MQRLLMVAIALLSVAAVSSCREAGGGRKHAQVPPPAVAAPRGPCDSPWPKFGGNARNSGLSPYVGAQTAKLKWEFKAGWALSSNSPAIGPDGTIYVGSAGVEWGGDFYAVNPDGTEKWRIRGSVDGTPATAADGTIYVGSYRYNGSRCLYAINPNGTEKWRLPTEWDVLG